MPRRRRPSSQRWGGVRLQTGQGMCPSVCDQGGTEVRNTGFISSAYSLIPRDELSSSPCLALLGCSEGNLCIFLSLAVGGAESYGFGRLVAGVASGGAQRHSRVWLWSLPPQNEAGGTGGGGGALGRSSQNSSALVFLGYEAGSQLPHSLLTVPTGKNGVGVGTRVALPLPGGREELWLPLEAWVGLVLGSWGRGQPACVRVCVCVCPGLAVTWTVSLLSAPHRATWDLGLCGGRRGRSSSWWRESVGVTATHCPAARRSPAVATPGF